MYRILQPGWNRTCQGITRRELLQVGSISALGLSLPTALRAAEIREVITAITEVITATTTAITAVIRGVIRAIIRAVTEAADPYR
jgi:hypothetical protein